VEHINLGRQHFAAKPSAMTTPSEALQAVQHAEMQSLRAKNLELRGQQERLSKELAVCKQQLQQTTQQLHEETLARGTTAEYARQLENKIESGQKGVALLKAAKLQVGGVHLRVSELFSRESHQLCTQGELEFLQKENALLFSDLQAKVR
jgi:hypothetical protein